MSIQPISPIGLSVLFIFSFGMALIILEAKLHIDKFKPALLMLSSFLLIGIYTYFSGDDPQRFDAFLEMQKENKVELFSLIAFMAFMWMIVEILAERGVFSTLNSYLISKVWAPRKCFGRPAHWQRCCRRSLTTSPAR